MEISSTHRALGIRSQPPLKWMWHPHDGCEWFSKLPILYCCFPFSPIKFCYDWTKSKCSINLHTGNRNHFKYQKRSATEQIELEGHAYYFLQLSRFGAIEFIPRGLTVSQECCVSLQGVYEKQNKMTRTLPAALELDPSRNFLRKTKPLWLHRHCMSVSPCSRTCKLAEKLLF
jgi:hypothetical protein